MLLLLYNLYIYIHVYIVRRENNNIFNAAVKTARIYTYCTYRGDSGHLVYIIIGNIISFLFLLFTYVDFYFCSKNIQNIIICIIYILQATIRDARWSNNPKNAALVLWVWPSFYICLYNIIYYYVCCSLYYVYIYIRTCYIIYISREYDCLWNRAGHRLFIIMTCADIIII